MARRARSSRSTSIRSIQQHARDGRKSVERPRWPMIVLRSPKGWTGPKEVDGKKVEGFWRAHQVPSTNCREQSGASRRFSKTGCAATSRKSCSTTNGRAHRRTAGAGARQATRRMGANPHANGGLLKTRAEAAGLPQLMPSTCRSPAASIGEATRELGDNSCATSIRLNAEARNFRIMGPDETASNRLDAVFEATERVWMERIEPYDVHLAQDGRVMEVLSEHLCQGWLEGYLLTGRHGLFSCYEAFIHIVDSMFNQHAKWLKVSRAPAVAAPDRLAQLSADLACLAAGPQRLQPSGSRLRRSRRQQEGRHRPHLLPARRQHAAVGRRPLPAHL